MFVLGTAGHVDHGKSVLIHALTGIDPDRLQEEKQRGMTIDLGFAWLKLPSGRDVSIVDVPGHERFVRNMLAGAGGIDLALLVIAADEGVMPQTREHLAILDLLGVDRGIVVITKKDLVDEEMLELVSLEVADELQGTTLAGAPLQAVSAFTGEGLPELLGTIDALLDDAPEARDLGRPRLAIDRAFTIRGYGTVVTGTLLDGQLTSGQEVEVLPPAFRCRIRGLQTHKKQLDIALPGTRVAVNLSDVSPGDLQRGYIVTTPGWLTPTGCMDVKLRLLASGSRPLPHNAVVTFHTGASEVMARVRLLQQQKLLPGETAWAQLVLPHPVAVVKKGRFIIRSSGETLGGGVIVDPYSLVHRRFRDETIDTLRIREEGSPGEILESLLNTMGPMEQEKLLTLANLSPREAQETIDNMKQTGRVLSLGGRDFATMIVSAAGWQRLVARVTQVMQGYHQQFPLRRGMPREELRSRLSLTEDVFALLLLRLLKEEILFADGLMLRLSGFRPDLSQEEQIAVDAFIAEMEKNPFSPSSEAVLSPELLNWLVQQQRVVKVSADVIFAASAYKEMVARVTDYINSHGSITVAQVRDLFGTSRKYALAFMEYLDKQKITRRVGDERVLR